MGQIDGGGRREEIHKWPRSIAMQLQLMFDDFILLEIYIDGSQIKPRKTQMQNQFFCDSKN